MIAKIPNGSAIAKTIRDQIADAVSVRLSKELQPPGFAVLLIGKDPTSEIHVHHKLRDCQEVGFKHAFRNLSANTAEQDLAAMIDELNTDQSIDGILVQLPVPEDVGPMTHASLLQNTPQVAKSL